MASEVDIANLALAHLGDSATVASLDPPEGSAQAEHCARFYPIARDSLLEMHPWGFATKRVQLAQLGTGWPEWDYSYAQPADALNIIAVLPPDSTDDYSIGLSSVPMSAGGSYVPQAYSCEVDANDADVIYTDQIDAVLRYTALVSDTTKFSPLFVMTLSWHLAAMLAGPIFKGDTGAAEAKRCTAMMQIYLSKATESDAGQRRINPQHNVGWISGR
jgi:hypothetical protein